MKTDVAIIGAGGGGAILGIILARKGIKNVVLEQAPGPPQGLRGEILQPNGQQLLANLGLLPKLPKESYQAVRYFHFRRAGGTRLCTIDYGMLPEPYNRALVMWPNVVHHMVLEVLKNENPDQVYFGTSFHELKRDGGRVTGVVAKQEGKVLEIDARVVVGADGPFSRVRDAMGMPARLHRYEEGYLIAMLETSVQLEEAQYYVGDKTILGIFPAAGKKIYVFYMIQAESLPHLKTQGILALRETWKRIAPEISDMFDGFESWEQTAYMGTGRVRAQTWVMDGGVLIGDAAHGMNPHASQGRMQAMMDAAVLGEVLERCQANQDWSARALKDFETQRRPQVVMLQRLADEEVFFWNTGNPLLRILRDRVFSTIDTNSRLQYQILTVTAGLRSTPPFGWLDRLQAAGFLPDPNAHHIPVEG